MPAPDLRAYAICRVCAEAHHPGTACPRCAGAPLAAPPRRRGPVELADPWFERRATPRARTSRAPAAAFGVVVTATLALLILAIAQS